MTTFALSYAKKIFPEGVFSKTDNGQKEGMIVYESIVMSYEKIQFTNQLACN